MDVQHHRAVSTMVNVASMAPRVCFLWKAAWLPSPIALFMENVALMAPLASQPLMDANKAQIASKLELVDMNKDPVSQLPADAPDQWNVKKRGCVNTTKSK